MIQNLTRLFLCFPALAVVGFALSLQQRDGVSIGPHAPSSEFDVFCDQDKGMHCPCLISAHAPPIRQQMIYDGRALEAFENVSKATFFKRHGFVILNLSGVQDTPIEQVTDILFPYSKIRLLGDPGVTAIRGPNDQPYALGENHQDTCLNASGWVDGVTKKSGTTEAADGLFTEGLDMRPEFDFMYFMNLWGPLGMKEPLMHAPLAVEDPTTADMREIDEVDKIIPLTDPPVSQWYVNSHCQAGNRWYYYPNMLSSEFIVFTHFVHHRGDDFFKPYMRSNLHGAFDNPFGVNREPRRSGERRPILLGTNYDRSTDGQRVSL